jgi:hypothetical protein
MASNRWRNELFGIPFSPNADYVAGQTHVAIELGTCTGQVHDHALLYFGVLLCDLALV